MKNVQVGPTRQPHAPMVSQAAAGRMSPLPLHTLIIGQRPEKTRGKVKKSKCRAVPQQGEGEGAGRWLLFLSSLYALHQSGHAGNRAKTNTREGRSIVAFGKKDNRRDSKCQYQ